MTKDGHLDSWARCVVEAGLSPSVHAIGDEAARLVLDAFEGLDRTKPLRVEHAQQLAPDDIGRFKGLVASMQPLHTDADSRPTRITFGCRQSILSPWIVRCWHSIMGSV